MWNSEISKFSIINLDIVVILSIKIEPHGNNVAFKNLISIQIENKH